MRDSGPTSGSARRRQRITEQAAHWYLDLRDGLDEDQRTAFLGWLKTSPEHVAEYLAIAQLHGDLKPAMATETLSIGELGALAATEPAVVPLHRPASPNPPARRRRTATTRRPRRGRWLAVAGVALTMLGGTLAWQLAMRPEADVYATTAGHGQSFDLADGTLLQLDRDSAITVHFGNRRRDFELLRGTAMISVGKDPARPLQLTLGTTVLHDIGTVFEVTRRAHGGSVTVISGQVDLLAPDARAWSIDRWLHAHRRAGHVIAAIHRGEQAQVDDRGHLTAFTPRADIARATAWLPTEIRFRQRTVAEVARRFNAYTTRPLLIESRTLAGMRISGRFHAHDMDALVAYLATFPGARVQRGKDAIRIVVGTETTPVPARL